MSTIKKLQRIIHKDNVERGWWNDLGPPWRTLQIASPIHRSAVIAKLCLIHSEISEALEEIREGMPFAEVRTAAVGGKPLGFPTELADAVIRILDLAEACDIDLEEVIKLKLAYNRTRGHRHGGKLL